MTSLRLALFTLLAMLAFAANSLLCRIALSETDIDAASFTSLRLISGALVLWLLVCRKPGTFATGGNWTSAWALFVYAMGFSFAYLQLSAGTGALILFGAVQCTMIGWGLHKGERLTTLQTLAVLVAFAGLLGLLLPGVSAPPLAAAILMLIAGMAWGVYSIRGKGATHAGLDTAGNFLRAVPLALIGSLLFVSQFQWDMLGALLALCSGGIASGLGYIVWYQVLPVLPSTTAAIVQICVPALAALGGVLLLSEPLTLRLVLASVAILGGLAVFFVCRKRPA